MPANIADSLGPDQNGNRACVFPLTLFAQPLPEAHVDQAADYPSRSRPAPGFQPVERFDGQLKKLAADMLDTMYDAPGIGLAAIQVGEPLRMLVIDLAKEDEPKAPQIFINPEIVERSDDVPSTRKAACRSPTTTRRSSGRPRCGSNISTSTATRTRSPPKGCSRPAFSTRSTISTACCSSTTSRG